MKAVAEPKLAQAKAAQMQLVDDALRPPVSACTSDVACDGFAFE